MHEKMPVELIPGPQALGGAGLAGEGAVLSEGSDPSAEPYYGSSPAAVIESPVASYYGGVSNLLNDSSSAPSYYGSSSGLT